MTIGTTMILPAGYWANAISGNGGDNGMIIISNGAVSISKVMCDNNYNGNGAHIDNSDGTGAVTISDSTFLTKTTGMEWQFIQMVHLTLTNVQASKTAMTILQIIVASGIKFDNPTTTSQS